MRFAKNLNWEEELRAHTGLYKDVAAFITSDPSAITVLTNVKSILSETLEKMRREGRPHVTIGFGCTGGCHRSVWGAQQIVEWVANQGHLVKLMHREFSTKEKLD